MQTKPFSIQSPESIAMEYGGNKQKIASATQMGLLDPTAAVLAGMFIDRMRSAAIQEQAPTSTVAQKVLGKAPPAPPAPPPAAAPAPGGLGSIPVGAAPSPAPQAAPPMPAMADGGIVNIPIPDSMFDEPDNGGYNDGYAQGGIVAFAGGGVPGWASDSMGPAFESLVLNAIPGTRVTSRQRSRAANAAANGVTNSYHLTNNARDFVPPPGMSMDEFTARVRQIPGIQKLGADVIYEGPGAAHSTGPHVHIEPGGGHRTSAPYSTQAPAMAAASQYPTAPGTMPKISAPDFLSLVNRYQTAVGANSPDTTQRQALMADLAKEISPEEVAKDKKRDMWMALAQMGIGMAASKSPHFLQAVAEGAQQAMPQVQASEKERKTEKRANQQAMLTLENMSNEDKQKAYALAIQLANAQAGLLTTEQELNLKAAVAQLDANTRMAVESISASVQKYNADTQAATSRYATDAGMTNNMIDNLFSLTNNITTNATRQNVAATKAGVTPGSNMLNTGAMPTGQTDPNAGYSYEPVQ